MADFATSPSDLKEKEDDFISDKDLEVYFGAGVQKKILKYSEIDPYEDIREVLPDEKDFVIILLENRPDSGHWVL